MKVLIFILVVVLATGCTSFSKLKKKYGKESQQLITIDFEKLIPADSLELEFNLSELQPLIPVVLENDRNKITIVADGKGNIIAKSVSKNVLILDSIQKKIDKISFHEADFKGYVSRKEAGKLITEAKRQGIAEGKAKKGFFDRIEDGLLQLFWIILIIVALYFFIRKITEKNSNNLNS